MPNTDVLIFVEDSGAANYIAQLPGALAEKGLRAKIVADSYAKDCLGAQGILFEEIKPCESAVEILNHMKPKLMIIGTSGNSGSLGLKLIEKARSFKIKSIGVVDAPMHVEYRFSGESKNPFFYAPDWLLVPDEYTKNIYVSAGYSNQQIAVCGHPHYDHMRKVRAGLKKNNKDIIRKRLLPGRADNQKTVIFAADGSARLKLPKPPLFEEYTLKGKGLKRGRTEIVLEEFLDAVRTVKPRPYLGLRLHPKDVIEDYKGYIDEFDMVNSGGVAFELMYVSDLVVSLTSMLLMEAVLLGIATLSILPRVAEKDQSSVVRSGVTPCVTTREELGPVLNGFLCDDTKEKYEEEGIGNIIPYGSLQKVVEFIVRALQCTRID